MAAMDDLLDKFFQTRNTVLNDYTENIDSPGELVKTILELVDNLEEKQTFSDKKELEQFYLTYLPKETMVFPDEVLAIHEVLLDFYQFLQENDYLSMNEYKDLLTFFQKNKHTFIDRMSDEKFWSPDKKKQMEELDKEMLDSMPPEMNDLLQGLSNMVQDSQNNRQKNNIVDFPSNKTQKISDDSSYAVQLRIDLAGFKPPIWRRVLIPFDYTLTDLHAVIQDCFEWENAHLYLFIVDGAYYEPAENLIDDFWDLPSEDPSSITVGEIFYQSKTIDYIYDLGDDWQHKIKCEHILPADQLKQNFKKVDTSHLPVCVTGRQGAPLEDTGEEEGEFVPFEIDKINARLAKL
ncbi:MAG: plasmid pRiA4b ORF-3 family protein [Tetragenococcus sp.]|nr:plasmid pRiA4b ORF-3 family protein [Tetragenococcus sp.]